MGKPVVYYACPKRGQSSDTNNIIVHQIWAKMSQDLARALLLLDKTVVYRLHGQDYPVTLNRREYGRDAPGN
jgi:hypothetical protein